MTRPRILVVGSMNMDMVLEIERMPAAGENLFVKKFSMHPGGKGNNQAIACSRLGGVVRMVGKVGDDDFGERLLINLEQENVDYCFVFREELMHTGLAFIFVEESGENRILVAPGANMALSCEDLERAAHLFKSSDFLLLQLEVPLEVVKRAIKMAHEIGLRVILNPAPAQPFPLEILGPRDIITPNKYEAEVLSGMKIERIEDAVRTIKLLDKRCPSWKVITLGEMGAVASYRNDSFLYLHPRKVEVRDTTAAGDAFNAGLVVGIGQGKEWVEALLLANNAGAIACTKVGAQSALPYLRDIERFVSENGRGEFEIVNI